MSNTQDLAILRDLAKQLAEIAGSDIQEERRELWRRLNNLERVRPPVYVRHGGWEQEVIPPLIKCEDPFYRQHEYNMRFLIFQNSIGDDYVIEPWITQKASLILPNDSTWGIPWDVDHGAGGGFHCNPVLKDWEDMSRLVTPKHQVDEAKTAENVDKITEAVGDIIEIDVDRSPHWSFWHADISTDLGFLRGQETLLYDVVMHPDQLHALAAFMRDGILKAQEEAEIAGDWSLSAHQNQAMPYAATLKDPKANSGPVKREELWCYSAAQEFTAIGPAHHDELLLAYQKPIMEKFGLSAYGCCEDLSHKIDMLRKVKNLRRIAVSPFADVRKCAEQIGSDYVCSYRPAPWLTVSHEFDEQRIRDILRRDLAIFREHGCIVDISLKDVKTVENDPGRFAKFAQIARAAAEEY